MGLFLGNDYGFTMFYYGDLWEMTMMYERYPLVICFGLLLNMAIEIADLPINSMVIFHSYVKGSTEGIPLTHLQPKC